MNSELQLTLLIKYLLDPKIPLQGCKERARYKPTDFKTLNAMYQLNKNILLGKWRNFSCGKPLIAEVAEVSVKAVTRFLCGEGLLFLSKTEREGRTNLYSLSQDFVDLMRFFEKKGLMRDIRDDFEKWRKTFLRKLNKWLIPLLEKGLTLKQLLMNKLSTKRKLKGAGLPTLKGASIKPSVHEALRESKSNTEQPKLPVLDRFSDVASQMLKFGIQEGDVNAFMGIYSLNHLKKAVGLYGEYKRNGIEPRSKAALYQSCLVKVEPNRFVRR